MFLIARWVKGHLGAPDSKQLEGFLWSTTTAEVDEAVEMPLEMPIVLTDAASPPVSSGVTLRKKAVTSSTENSNVQKNGGGMFTCSYCSRSFATAGILKNHEQEHAEMMPYRCDICGKGFKHKRSQNRHHKLHSGQRKYKCTMCDSRFFRSDHLKLHMKTHEVSKYAFVCVLCQRGFNSNSALESHLQVYHSNEAPAQDAAQPDVEDKIQPSSPVIHVKEEEEEEYEEAPLTSMSNVENPSQLRCDARSVGETLLAHAESMHGLSVPKRSDSAPDVSNAERSGSVSTTGGQYACCVLCSLNFDSSEAFEAHLEAVHHGGTTDRPLLSQFNELASTLPSLTAGVDSWPSSNTATAYSCGFCGELKANVGDLQKHTLHKHSLKDLQLPPISADPTYDCDFCGRCFDSILALHCHASSAHRKSAATVDGVSTNVQAYQCGQCDTALNPLRMFTGQMPALRQNAGGRRCHLCGLVAESDDRLNSHLLTHYLQKECRQCCQACGRWFLRADELNEHMFQVHAVHAYRCSLCGSLFDSRADMQRHLVAAHVDDQVRHRCRACGAAFDSGDQFLAHVRLAHMLNTNTTITAANSNNNNNSKCSPSPPEPHYYCTVCCLAFDSEAEYRAHSHAAFQCSPLCSNSFSGQHLYEQRVPNEHGIQTSTSDEEPQQLDNGPGSPVNNANNKCNICDKKCSSLIELAQHKLQHCKVVHSETCAVCRAPIGSVEQFFAHVRTHNSNATGGVAPACIICKQSLLSTVEMHTHAKFHLRLDNASYNHWPRQHLVSSKTEAHVPGDGLHPRCMLCQKVFISPAKLQCHLIEHSFSGGSGFQCYLCATAFPLPQTLQQHITSAHSRPEDRPYQCSTCGGRFFFRAELDHHTLAEHGRGAETPTTPSDETTVRYCFCGQSVPDLAAFQSHLSVCTAAKGGDPAAASALELLAWTAFPDDAEKVKQILALLSSAMAAVASTTTAPLTPTTTSVEVSVKAEPNSGVPLSTTAAGARQTRNKRLSSSPPAVLPAKMAKISASKTTTAVSAPTTPTTVTTTTTTTTTTPPTTTTTTTAAAAVTVKATRTMSRSASSQQRGSHPCPHCSKVFHSPSALQGHSHVHMGSRIHQCSKCQREFPTAAKMRNHQRQHSGDKPFPCEVCGRYFSRKDNLKVHMKTHFKYSALSSLNDLPTMVSPMSRCLYNTSSSIGPPPTSVVESQTSSTSATNATGTGDESTSAVPLRPQQLIA
ncbi:Zinc finger protein [Trichinella patagoniensis]|uniref:Zinc finger protein n=1 Tax=Trichinella patagoniensis TaxID=990121 RepID=A0A0V0ZV45_9BILA|nr:Zinc finger protein [Trichinella patagoniensis]